MQPQIDLEEAAETYRRHSASRTEGQLADTGLKPRKADRWPCQATDGNGRDRAP